MFIIQSINTNLINIEMMEMHMHEIFYLFGIRIALFAPLEVHNKRTKKLYILILSATLFQTISFP